MLPGDNFIWDAEEAVRNLYHDQSIADRILAMPMSEEDADLALTNSLRRHQVRLGAALVQPVAGALAASHQRADADHVGQERQAVPGRLRQALGRAASPAAGSRSSRDCGHVPAVEKPDVTAKEIVRQYAGTR